MPRANCDHPYVWVVLTDENQILFVGPRASQAYRIKDKWEATHAAEAFIVECDYLFDQDGWVPTIPPNAELEELSRD